MKSNTSSENIDGTSSFEGPEVIAKFDLLERLPASNNIIY